ncbi:MAG: hypothetical protein CMI30_01015 [Opitutae bacterium]|nr:hypothetical protein [Opitutae bacterium]|tara:strand:+ start:2677 stop:4551 length:1875 start_codon:yes stop_codon:yes gene_type:complete
MKFLIRVHFQMWGLAFVGLFSGCVSMPNVQTLEFQDSNETYTSERQVGTPEVWDQVERLCADGKSRVGLLEHGDDALVARVNLIRSARKHIRIQTFIWSHDESGRWLMWELIRAVKQRGVTVEILIDQMFSGQNPAFAAFLSQVDPKLTVKVYNPNVNRLQPSTFDTLVDLASDFRRVNVRMHNKVMIIDDHLVITGGRNVSNKYFDRSIGMNYKDRDVLVVSSDCESIKASFQEYWKSDWAIPVEQLLDVKELIDSGDYSKLSNKGHFDFRGLFTQADQHASDAAYVQRTFADKLRTVRETTWIFDDPKKKGASDPAKGADIALELANLVNSAQKSIIVQSPYVVISGRARELFSKLKKERPDLTVSVSTNSLAATDSWFTYAANYKEKRVYLEELGFDLREFKPIPTDIHEMMAYDTLLTRLPTPKEAQNETEPQFRIDKDLPPFPMKENNGSTSLRMNRRNDVLGVSPYLCLHGKSLVIDDELSYVGSYNLDPRSGSYNTEVGLVIKDAAFARELRQLIEKDMAPRNSYLISIKKGWPVLRTVNFFFYRISEDLPLLDPWPFRFASSFELRKGKEPVERSHPDFHQNWRDVGSFPLMSFFARKKMASRLFKATGMFFKPLL